MYYMLPKYLYRQDDNEKFSLNEDGETYSIEFMKVKFPKSFTFKYRYEVLMSYGFRTHKNPNI